jgi:hypothetical protein
MFQKKSNVLESKALALGITFANSFGFQHQLNLSIDYDNEKSDKNNMANDRFAHFGLQFRQRI